MTLGHNFDFESYQKVLEAGRLGLTPWQTNRYNYGPTWSLILRAFDWTGSKTNTGLRFQIVALLTIADLYISYFIYRFKGPLIAALFFVNPISVFITGYHNQFDNLAIAIVCGSILVLKRNNFQNIFSQHLIAVILLGITLTLKHIFLFFILWLMARQKTVLLKLLYLFGPLLLLALSMLPYLGSSWASIKLNVIDYKSFNNSPFLTLIGLEEIIDPTSFFVLLMCALAYIFRKIELEQSFFIYCVLLVTFSPAVANQYLVTAAVGAFGLLNRGFIVYTIYGGYWLMVSHHGLGIVRETRVVGNLFYFVPLPTYVLHVGYTVFPILLIYGLTVCYKSSRQSGSVVERRTRNA